MKDAFTISPFFLPTPSNRRLFCVLIEPKGETKGSVVYLHPFAEEMHKSRRMAALQARSLASRGYRVLQCDLTGCGDSEGDFSDATWQTWLDDAKHACAWLKQKYPDLPLSLWGLRTGATLAAQLATELTDIQQLCLWQPVTAGELFLTQFLRIKLASEMLSEGQSQTTTKQLLAELNSGVCIEVGGYMLSPAMAQELVQVKLSTIQPKCKVAWLELGAESLSNKVSPASTRVVDAWRNAGIDVAVDTLQGEPFWGVQEITECLALIETTNNKVFS